MAQKPKLDGLGVTNADLDKEYAKIKAEKKPKTPTVLTKKLALDILDYFFENEFRSFGTGGVLRIATEFDVDLDEVQDIISEALADYYERMVT